MAHADGTVSKGDVSTVGQVGREAGRCLRGHPVGSLDLGHGMDEWFIGGVTQQGQIPDPLQIRSGADVVEVAMGAQQMLQATTGGFTAVRKVSGSAPGSTRMASLAVGDQTR